MGIIKIFEAVIKAEKTANENGVILKININNFIDDDCLDVNGYPNDTEFMSMEYKGYLVNVYIGSWDAFKEGEQWIDYDIFDSDDNLMNDGDDIYPSKNVLKAATDIEFYINKIENIISIKEC